MEDVIKTEVYTIEPSTTMPTITTETKPIAFQDDTPPHAGLCPVETTPVFSDPETRSVKHIKEVPHSSPQLEHNTKTKRKGSKATSVKLATTTTETHQSKEHPCCGCHCCRPIRISTTMKFIVTRVFFTSLLGIYILVGAVLFFCLESPMESLQQAEFNKWKNDTAILLATELRQVKPYEEVWVRTVYHYLDSFERDVLQVCQQGYRRADSDSGSDKMWTIHSAFLFSVSILTTTGYVGTTLRSPWARVALLVYSAFGIPMMVSWLASIGAALANLWTWIYKRVCCALYVHRYRRIEPRYPQDNQYSAASQEYSEQLQTNLATPLLPANGNNNVTRRFQSLEDAGRSSAISVQEIQQAEIAGSPPTDTNNAAVQTRSQQQVQPYKPAVEDFVLPTLLSLLIFLMYFIFGSAMVSVQEDWTLVDSVYFVYLHFTTLGIGSFQPTPTSKTTNYGSPSAVKHDVLFVCYLIFGYCLLSMILCLIMRFVWKKRKRKHNLSDTMNNVQRNDVSSSQLDLPNDAART